MKELEFDITEQSFLSAYEFEAKLVFDAKLVKVFDVNISFAGLQFDTVEDIEIEGAAIIYINQNGGERMVEISSDEVMSYVNMGQVREELLRLGV